jgi:hypothetical protein
MVKIFPPCGKTTGCPKYYFYELYHAAGHNHDSGKMFCHAYDILTLELYKLIYGEDPEYIEAINSLRGMAEEILIYSKSLKN